MMETNDDDDIHQEQCLYPILFLDIVIVPRLGHVGDETGAEAVELSHILMLSRTAKMLLLDK
jgi:hypothetical protein